MGLIEITLLVAGGWCLFLMFAVAILAIAAKADDRDDVMIRAAIGAQTRRMPEAEAKVAVGSTRAPVAI